MSTEIQHPDNWLYIEKQPIKKSLEFMRALFKAKVRFGVRPKRFPAKKRAELQIFEYIKLTNLFIR